MSFLSDQEESTVSWVGAWQPFLDHEHFTALMKKKQMLKAVMDFGFVTVSVACTESMMDFLAADFTRP